MHNKTDLPIVMPYFMVGNAGKFIDFLKAVFNAELISRQTGENSEDVIHAEMKFNGNRILLADSGLCGGEWISPSSTGGSCATSEGGGKPIQMFVEVENVDETSRKALAAGGMMVMEPYNDDGGRMCGIADPFHNLWWFKSTAH
jgi:PhnB protein